MAVGLNKPPFELTVAACQPAATLTVPAATIAILQLVETAASPYCRLKRRQESNRRFEPISTNVESFF
jgi:hypothetical protein